MMLLLEACEKLAEEECTAETKPPSSRRSAPKRNYAAVDYSEGDQLNKSLFTAASYRQTPCTHLCIRHSQLGDILLPSVQQATPRPRASHTRHRLAPSTLPTVVTCKTPRHLASEVSVCLRLSGAAVRSRQVSSSTGLDVCMHSRIYMGVGWRLDPTTVVAHTGQCEELLSYVTVLLLLLMLRHSDHLLGRAHCLQSQQTHLTQGSTHATHPLTRVP
jgi:hypothetical protein